MLAVTYVFVTRFAILPQNYLITMAYIGELYDQKVVNKGAVGHLKLLLIPTFLNAKSLGSGFSRWAA